ncbi:MAG: TonB-dependent receptor plug domain-containing protein, partial [Opitutaceae bacterium]|nr:TonB-dependent receptor plug domain-containing protein [Opitutaceae bacterium]
PAPRPPDTSAALAPVLELETFSVTSDKAIGYRSLDSISGSNSRIAVRDLPQSISVFTSEFMQDIGAGNLAESVAYAASLTSGRNIQQFNRVEFSLRGFPATTLREGLTWSLGNDGYNIDRIEVVKGPAAVLYGASQPGGFVNVIAKRPRAKAGGSAKVTLGRYDRHRAEFDLTGPAAGGGQLLFRFAGAYEKFDSFREWENGENTYLNPMVTWKPFRRVAFTASHELQRSRRTPNNQTPILYPSSAAPAALTNAASPPAAWQALGWADVPRRWNDVGPFSFEDMDVRVTNTDLQADLAPWLSLRNRLQFLDLDRMELRRTGNRVNLYSTAAAFLARTPNASGIPTPNTTVIGNGGQFKTTNYTPERREAFVAKTELVAKSGRARWVDNTLLAGLERTDAYIDQATYRIPAAVHPNFTFDLANTAGQPLDQYYQIHPGPAYSVFEPALFTQVLTSNRNKSKGEAYYFVDHLALFDRRLHLSAGIRFRRFGDWDDAGTVPQYGFVYQPSRQISLFALRNDSYVINAPSATAANPPPQTGKNQEVGAKLEFLDGRVGLTASWFRVQREGIARNVATAVTGVFETQYSGLERSDGFEIEAYWSVTKDWNIYGGYTYADARIVSGDAPPAANSLMVGTAVQSAPLHKGSVWQRFRFGEGWLKGFSLGTGVIAASDSQAYSQADRLNLKNDAYVRFDASAGYERTLAGRPFRFQLNVWNLADATYRDVQGGLAAPLAWRFSTEVRF